MADTCKSALTETTWKFLFAISIELTGPMSTNLLNILPNDDQTTAVTRQRLPKWLKRPLPQAGMQFTSDVIADLRLETVCESAKCPNRTECWSQQTATFMILGNVCTRPCGFCSVLKGKTEVVQLDEPREWPKPPNAWG